MEAASWNALAGNWCELDEGFRLAICHAGIYTLPALLAEATATRARLRDVLTALTGAYELVTRCAMSFHVMPPPVHGHALWSAVGAAAAVSLLRGHDAQTLLRAVSGAITTASMGPRSHLMAGVLIRNGWAAAGAVNGMQCADWAECGFGGAPASMEEVCAGIVKASLREGEITRELGTRWSLSHGYQKLYSCCQHGHSAVQACLALRADPGFEPQRIRAIRLDTHALALTLDTVHPTTTLGARFSMPHMVAAALALGTGSAAAFSQSTLSDPAVAALREKVRMRLADARFDEPNTECDRNATFGGTPKRRTSSAAIRAISASSSALGSSLMKVSVMKRLCSSSISAFIVPITRVQGRAPITALTCSKWLS